MMIFTDFYLDLVFGHIASHLNAFVYRITSLLFQNIFICISNNKITIDYYYGNQWKIEISIDRQQ